MCIHLPAGQTCTCMCVCPNRNAGLAECVCAGRKDIDLSLWAHTVCPQAVGQCPRQSRPFTIITATRTTRNNTGRERDREERERKVVVGGHPARLFQSGCYNHMLAIFLTAISVQLPALKHPASRSVRVNNLDPWRYSAGLCAAAGRLEDMEVMCFNRSAQQSPR